MQKVPEAIVNFEIFSGITMIICSSSSHVVPDPKALQCKLTENLDSRRSFGRGENNLAINILGAAAL